MLNKNGNKTSLTSLSKSSTSFILVNSAVQRGKMFCQNAGRYKQNSTVSQLTKEF